MSELSVLQEIVMNILQENAERSLLGKPRCFLRNQEIFELIKDKKMRPSSIDYLSQVLGDLAHKNKIKKETNFVPGFQGKKRVITIL